VVGDIRSRALERQPVGREVYFFLFMNKWDRDRNLHKLCLVKGWMFRVVIVNCNIAVWSYEVAKILLLFVYL
jgi:hypothetical protein